MKNIIYILFGVFFFISCKKELNHNILDGKIKTLEWRSNTSIDWVKYQFSYDSLGYLDKVISDSLDYLSFYETTDSIKMVFKVSYMNNVITTEKQIAINPQKRVISIREYDYLYDEYEFNYSFDYYNDTLKFAEESYLPFNIYYADRNISDYGHLYSDGNCTYFYASWGGYFAPGWPVNYNDTVEYTFNSTINDGQIPMQFPLRTYDWNNFEPLSGQGSNMLYMLGLKKIGKNINKNLINSIKFSGSENYTLKYEYVTNGNNQIIEMNMKNLNTDEIFYTFKMTYY